MTDVPLSPSEALAAIRALHYPVDAGGDGGMVEACWSCYEPWPCETRRVLDCCDTSDTARVTEPYYFGQLHPERGETQRYRLRETWYGPWKDDRG